VETGELKARVRAWLLSSTHAGLQLGTSVVAIIAAVLSQMR